MDRTINELRNYVRCLLLTESAKTVSEIPDDVAVVITDVGDELDFKIQFKTTAKTKWSNSNRLKNLGENLHESGIFGVIVIKRISPKHGKCNDAMYVSWSQAAKGWGPILYDIAIELATELSGGLVADREHVSYHAQKIWAYYDSNRSDVTKVQLDNLEDSFKDGPFNDCTPAIDGLGFESPMGYMYSKEPTTINILKKQGKWFEE